MIWTRLSALIVKELLAAFRDPKARIALIVPPLLQLFLFAYAATLEVSNVPVGVLNQDWGMASEQLVSRFERASAFSELAVTRACRRHRRRSTGRNVMVVVHIGQDFSRKLAAGEQPAVEFCSTAASPTAPSSSTATLAPSSASSGRITDWARMCGARARSSTVPGTMPIGTIARQWCRSSSPHCR